MEIPVNKQSPREYVPAIKSESWLLLYDPLLRWTMRESTFKRRLVEQARIEPRHRVLDLGCGTATLTILIRRAQPAAEVVGLDADPKILELARAKVSKSGLAIPCVCGMSFELPYADASFDRVLSSLLFHHLTRENKLRTLGEVYRVLRREGELHVADYGKPQNALMRLAFRVVEIVDGRETTEDHVCGLLPGLFRQAGFVAAEQTAQFTTVSGTLVLYKARKPAP